MHQLRYAKYHDIDVVNGEGTRCTLFVTGCEFNCRGCYNRSIRKFESGHLFDQEMEDTIITDLKDEEIPRRGLSILGGEPLHPNNLPGLLKLVKRIKEECPTKDIWIWTGYIYEELSPAQQEITELSDIVVDGQYIESLKDPNLVWRGSSNQRIIKVNERGM